MHYALAITCKLLPVWHDSAPMLEHFSTWLHCQVWFANDFESYALRLSRAVIGCCSLKETNTLPLSCSMHMSSISLNDTHAGCPAGLPYREDALEVV